LDNLFPGECESVNVPYLSVFNALQQEPILFNEVSQNDGAHPRSAGNQCYANLVYQWQGWKYGEANT
jgi:hypothetical protein